MSADSSAVFCMPYVNPLPHVMIIAARATVKPIIKTVAINGEIPFFFQNITYHLPF